MLYLTIWARTRDSDLLARVENDLSRVAISIEVGTIADENWLRLTEITIDSNRASLNQIIIESQYNYLITESRRY